MRPRTPPTLLSATQDSNRNLRITKFSNHFTCMLGPITYWKSTWLEMRLHKHIHIHKGIWTIIGVRWSHVLLAFPFIVFSFLDSYKQYGIYFIPLRQALYLHDQSHMLWSTYLPSIMLLQLKPCTNKHYTHTQNQQLTLCTPTKKIPNGHAPNIHHQIHKKHPPQTYTCKLTNHPWCSNTNPATKQFTNRHPPLVPQKNSQIYTKTYKIFL